MATPARSRCLYLGAALASLLGPVSAAAQTVPLSQVAPGDRLNTVDLTADATYESNVAGSNEQTALARGIHPSDFIIDPAVEVVLARPVGRQTLYLTGRAAYDIYTRNSRLSRENIAVTSGALGQISRCQLDASGSYSRSRNQLAETANVPGEPALQNITNIVELAQVTGGGSCGREVGLAPQFRVTQSWSRNSDRFQQGVNVNSFSTQEGLSYRRPSFGSLTLFGAYATTSYPERTIIDIIFNLPPTSAGFHSYSAGVTYTRPVGARLVGSASLSYTDLVNAVQGIKGFSGLTYSAAVTYSVTPRITAAVNISRATLPSNRLNSSFTIDSLYSAEADYQLTRRGTIRVGASYEDQNFGGVVVKQQFDLTREKIYAVHLDGDYRLNKRLTLTAGLRQTHRSANFPGLTYDDTLASVGVRAHF